MVARALPAPAVMGAPSSKSACSEHGFGHQGPSRLENGASMEPMIDLALQ